MKRPVRQSLSNKNLSIIGIPKKFYDISIDDFKADEEELVKVRDYVADYIFDGDYLLVSEDGANLIARSTPIAFSVSGKTWVNNHAHVLKFDTYELRRYVEIYLNSIDLSRYISGGAQPKLSQENLNKIPIPVLSAERIKYVVSILDRFDIFCNDLTTGLPSEIAARQKQYEYYRDKLLTFKEQKK